MEGAMHLSVPLTAEMCIRDRIYRLLPDIEAKPNVIKKLTEGEEIGRAHV